MRIFLINVIVFVLLAIMVALIGFFLLLEPGPTGRMDLLHGMGKRWLYRVGLVEQLTDKETKKLYELSCTRKCHGRDVIEVRARTAMEWEDIVTRMQGIGQAEKGGGIEGREAVAVVGYLKKHFLSNVPTVLPREIMLFLKKHLWRMDFGEGDLFLDVIYIPQQHRRLARYLLMRRDASFDDKTFFVVYVNTHQGIVPKWDLSQMISLSMGDSEESRRPIAWKVLYEDDQQHHRQGILTFPVMAQEAQKKTVMHMTIKLPNMRKRVFQWTLPTPPLEGTP